MNRQLDNTFFLKQIEGLITAGDYDQAELLTDEYFDDSENIIESLLSCKTAYQKIGKISKAMKSCNYILRLEPDNFEIIYELATMLFDTGKYDQFEKLILRCIEIRPSKVDLFEELCRYYRTHSRFDDLRSLLQKNKNHLTDDLYDELTNRYGAREVDTDMIQKPMKLSQSAMVDFLNLFQGRENVYARQWKDPLGKTGYVPVMEPVNLNVIQNHLFGNYTIGIYPVDLQNNVHFLVFDIDVQKYAQQQFKEDRKYRDKLLEVMQGICHQIIGPLKKVGVKSVIEFSGFKGYHIWVFLKSSISASSARLFGRKLIDLVNIKNIPVHIELFPKQGKVSGNNLGNLIKLPLGIHLKSGVRSYFTDESFAKIKATSILENPPLNNPEDIYTGIRYLERFQPDVTYEANAENSNDLPFEDTQAVDELSAIVSGKSILENNKEYQWLLTKCHALKTVVDKIDNKFEISNQERLVIAHTFGHLKDGAEVVNSLYRNCFNISPDQYMKSSFSGNPVSCPKIRSRLGALIDRKKCNCRFSDLLNTYPNPLLHLHEFKSLSLTADSDEWKLKNFIESYMQLRKDFSELKNQLGKKEKELFSYLDQAGLKEIDTSFGKFRIIRDGEKFRFRLEL